MWAVPIGLGVGALYLLSKSQAPPTTAKTVPGATQAVSNYIPTFSGEMSSGATGAPLTLLSIASQQLGIPPSELTVRGLRPEDLGLTTSWNFTSGAVNTWENWINTTVADNRFIAFQGVSYAGTNFSQIRIQAGARYVEYWNLNFISGLVSKLWFDDSISIAEQNQPVVIDVISKAALATESIDIIGTVVEKRGLTINP